MTREEKISAIYAEIANKKLKLWCKCKTHNWENVIFIRQNKTWSYLSIRENEEFTVSLWYTPEIIWHPVMIGNVIEYLRLAHEVFIEWQPIEDNTVLRRWRDYKTSINNLITLWYRADLPIEDQSDECVDFVYSLIPSKSME